MRIVEQVALGEKEVQVQLTHYSRSALFALGLLEFFANVVHVRARYGFKTGDRIRDESHSLPSSVYLLHHKELTCLQTTQPAMKFLAQR